MKKEKISLFLNWFIVLLTILSFVFMFLGIEFMGKSKLLVSTNIGVFKYFTVDSNLFVGISSLIYLLSKNKKSKIVSILKLSSTTSITITFLVTLLFLAPFNTYPFIEFYKNSNLFFHFLIPVCSIITFLFFDGCSKVLRKDLLWNLIPMLLYFIYYATNIIIHIENNVVSKDYDFYGFFKIGILSFFLVIPFMFGLTYLIGFFYNKKLT